MAMDERYLRQTMLSRVGAEGQRRLARASVVVVGAGGLGSPALSYLAAAGVGRLALIDSDVVSESNLNRQILYGDADIGLGKADAARRRLASLNGDIEVMAISERLTDANAAAILAGYDLVLGCVDSFDTRFVVNRAAAALGAPYIDGGVNGFNGCVVFSDPPNTPCLSCVFPSGSKKTMPTGVLGATAGVVGAIQANLALLCLLGQRSPIENKLLMYDGLRMSIELVGIRRDEHCPICGGGASS